MEKIYFTWEEFDKAIDIISSRIIGRKYKLLSIYGIPRGGLVVAVALSHKLNLPITSYINQFCLVCDDISDTGKTINRLLNSEIYTNNKYTVATIHFNQSSEFVPDIWVYEKPEGSWIIYPWENKE